MSLYTWYRASDHDDDTIIKAYAHRLSYTCTCMHVVTIQTDGGQYIHAWDDVSIAQPAC